MAAALRRQTLYPPELRAHRHQFSAIQSTYATFKPAMLTTFVTPFRAYTTGLYLGPVQVTVQMMNLGSVGDSDPMSNYRAIGARIRLCRGFFGAAATIRGETSLS